MDPSLKFERVDALLKQAVADGVVAGIGVCVRSTDRVLHRRTVGRAELRPNPRPATDSTPWDLASLTKVLATTPIAMSMVGRGELDLNMPVTDALPGASPDLTVEHLLSHSSGAAAWVPMVQRYGVAAQGRPDTRAAILRAAQAEPLQAPPGSAYQYSDLGFLMLASVLESVSGQRLDALFEDRVRGPSQADLRWGWPGAAATEDCPHRGRVVVGEVHDLNAWLMGGVSSHAGLFGTAASVAANAAWQLRAWSGRSDEGLQTDVVRRFFSTKGAGSHRLGWDGVSPGGSAGERWPRDGVGHLAFTGCSIWMAPQQGFVAVLVSNRLHPEVEGGSVPDAPIHPRYAAFRALRPAVHSAMADALGLASGVTKG